MLKVQDIEKADQIVRDRFPTCQMMKLSESKMIWINDHKVVAELIDGKPVSVFDR